MDNEEYEPIDYKAKEELGIAETIKYFDRIHDKLFGVNNILIGGYLALIAFKKDVPHNILWIPFCNMLVLVYIGYRMMLKSRMEARYGEFTMEKIEKYGKLIERTNLWSLLSIASSVIEVFLFIKYVS
jgi:hypothetical protein